MFRKYPSLCLLAVVVAGIVAADFSHLPSWLSLFFCLVFAVLGIVFLNRANSHRALLFLGSSLFCFAAYHFSIKVFEFGPNHISRFVSEKKFYQVFGKVADWPDLKVNRTEIKVAVDSLGRDQMRPVKGCILLKISDTTTAFQRGDRLEFLGTIYPLRANSNPGSFDYAKYLQLKEVFGLVYIPTPLDIRADRSRRLGIIGIVDRMRKALTDSFERNLSPVSAALASGILIGETRDIPDEVYRRFRDSGTLHLLAVSGSNVALVILFMILVLRPLSLKRKQRSIILIISVFVFALLSYGEPSVVRASLMASLVLLATILERRIDLNQIIATAALIILLIDPAQLFDVGFQLSFATAWGLIFITPRITGLFKTAQNRLWFRWIVFPLAVSLVAQMCSAPLIALYFDRVPAISVVANIVIVPLVSIGVVGALLLFLIDAIWPIMGLFFGSIIDTLLRVIAYFLELFGERTSLVIRTVDLSALAVVLIYIFLVLTTLALFNKFFRRIIVAAVVVLLNLGLTFSVVGAAVRHDVLNCLAVFNIPGGLAVILSPTAGRSPALFITGIQSKPYPLDERIFESALASLGIEKIDKLIVLSAEYGAMDDVLRLASKMGTKDLYVNQPLIRSFGEISYNYTDFEKNVELKTFGSSRLENGAPGIYLSALYVSLNFGVSEVVIANDQNVEGAQQVSGNGLRSLILSSYNTINTLAFEKIDHTQLSAIICSKIDQQSTSHFSANASCQIYSIESQGPCRLFIPGDSTDSFKVEPIK